ncbi:hypothetical protein ACH5RR_028437 [Cinchona calisaya]|uniref:Uncharacterized protein n=1 Tax=Cinchona calisaya TaxID=153742 RepID=A0ABD2YR05_9GENT
MASNSVNSVLHDLELLLNNLQRRQRNSFVAGIDDALALQQNLQFLKTFQLCARKWSNNDVYLDRNDHKKVELRSFLSYIETTVNKIVDYFRFLCLVSSYNSVVRDLKPLVSNLRENMKSFQQEIIKVYITLSDYNSSMQSTCCMSDDELVDFIDSILLNFVHLRSRMKYMPVGEDYNSVLQAQFEALEDKLKILKSFIGFAKLFCTKGSELEDLLIPMQFVPLSAARLSFMCYMCLSAYEYEEVPKMCSMMSELLQNGNPVHIQICEAYIKVLRALKSSDSLKTTKMDKIIVRDFNESLICSLWELLLCNSSFMAYVKGEMQILFEGLRFLRSILREPWEKMDKLDGKIVTVFREAAIVICSLYVNEVDVDCSVVRDSPDCCAMLVNINHDIKLIKTQIINLSITKSPPSYQIYEGQEVGKTSSLMPSKGKNPINHEVVVELEDETEKVIDRLVGGSENLEIIPIVGMAGLGKTTLAKKVYNNRSILHHFHIRLWCSVSQLYNKKKLLLQIFCNNGEHSRMNEELENLDEDDLLQKLYKKLKGNKYLVVFDDVWDIGVWNDLGYSFPDDKNGSRILFTSRFSNVASEVKIAREPHSLRTLTGGESWELLQKKVFGKADCPQALHGLGMEIAENCKGLPLTIVVIAGILATIEQDGWEEVAKSLTSTIAYETDDQCKNTLKLSYEYLPHHLKPCLLYFGAFPEDQEIHTKKLMSLWIAEGFVENTGSKRLEDLAEEYMVNLIGRNLVMVAKQRSIGGVEACRIHDLLHEFCKAKSKEENFLQVLREYDELSTFNEPPNLERLSIWSKVEHFKKSKLFCPRICSLLLFNEIEVSDSLMTDISFVSCIYKHLRVLDLEQVFLQLKVFPREVESLVDLRYLGVQGAMRFILPSISNLSNLETFLVISRSGTVSLPDTIWNMTNLRHLNVVGWDISCSLPTDSLENTSDLHNLDTFSTVIVSLDQVESIMSKIPNVRELKIKLSEAKESMGYCNVSSLESLESLEVSVTKSLPPNHVEFSFPVALKELVLGGLLLPWSKIQLIEELPNLEVLKLLYNSFKGERWDLTDGGFVKLRFLSLENLDVVEWTDADCGDPFPCLQKLMLTGLSKLEELPSCLECISSLEVIMVRQCDDSVKSLVRKIAEEQESYGNENLKMNID